MRLILIAVCALCASSIYNALTTKRDFVLEMPSAAVLSAQYDRTGRALQAMGEGFE